MVILKHGHFTTCCFHVKKHYSPVKILAQLLSCLSHIPLYSLTLPEMSEKKCIGELSLQKNQRGTLSTTGQTQSLDHLPQHNLGQAFTHHAGGNVELLPAAVITQKNEKQQPLSTGVGGLELDKPRFNFHFLIP